MARELWEGLPVRLGLVSAELQKAFSRDLESYLVSLKDIEKPSSFKIINDPIWFTIRVESWELIILDSPLIQRLRDIHQLGLAGLVYPAAGYSRFEHTIGTLYQAQRIIESVNRNARANSAILQDSLEQPISRRDEVALRLAALLHDVGHCFLSHVSERALNRLRLGSDSSMNVARLEAKEFFGSIKIPATAEVFSALCILLPQFIDILRAAEIPFWNDNEQELAYLLARLIVRGRSPDRPCINEIISGALDADKLDYMARDCYMAGLAMPIDTERLLEKLCVVSVASDELEDYEELVDLPRNQSIQVLAVQRGGAKVFEDFVLSRVLLYDKLYNHHKVRALEGAVVNVLDLLQKSIPSFKRISKYICMSDAEFLECRWLPNGKSKRPNVERAKQIILNVKCRNFVRAFAFGSSLILNEGSRDEPSLDGSEVLHEPTAGSVGLNDTQEDGEPEEDNWLNWGPLARVTSRDVTKESMAFRARLTNRVKKYLVILGQPNLADEMHESFLVIDLPDTQGITSRTKFFVGDEMSGVSFFNQLFRVEKWAEAYENQKITGYIFCPAKFAVAVHLAARDLIFEDFNLKFEPWSWQLTKVGIRQIEKAASRLIKGGIKTRPAPVPEELLRREIYLHSKEGKSSVLKQYMQQLDELEHTFLTYQSKDVEPITRHRMEDWLTQFAKEDIPVAVSLLRQIRYWSRARFVDAFALAINDWAKDAVNDQWLPLGGPTTSSRQLSYILPDLKDHSLELKRLVASANELQMGKDIVLYDDNVGSGGQGETVIKQWLGQKQESWNVDEIHVDALPNDKLEILRTSRIRFIFATGRRKGLNSLIRAAKKLLGNEQIEGFVAVPEEASCFRPAVFGDKARADQAQRTFRAAGVKAFSDMVGTWDQKKIDDRLLGYGNHGGLNVFYYNVPVTTVSALWKSSKDPSTTWMGLFPRRKRE